jgi:diguanylate cyclase (GGDEF)-like protein/PAS domain S-box-containing protein
VENNIVLKRDFNLIEKKKIALIISHRENENILKKYLKPEYEIITNDFSKSLKKADLIIADEQGLKENENYIFRSKKSDKFLYLPLLLITRISKENIPDKYLELIDEIIEIPIEKSTFNSRIKNLLSIRNLFLSTQVFQKLAENNPAGICILMEDKKIKYVNKAFLDIVEKNGENILNKNIDNFFPGQKLNDYFKKNNKEENISKNFKINIDNKNKWIDMQCLEINYENIELKSLILIDITERRKQQKEIEYLSYKDKLTDLYNRRFFEEEMDRLDTKRQLHLTIIMADVNGLKIINDSYGHKKGDLLLQKVAEILKNSIREEDILARQGGDEFAILLPNTNQKGAEKILKRIRDKIVETEDNKFPISIALGSAIKTTSAQNINDILKKADNNMYQNKLSKSRSNKNNIVQGLLNTLAAKSSETKEHSVRMTKLAFDFGEKLNLSNSELNRLSLLATLHDIGKINISEKTLNKCGDLNEKEWEIMKNHSEQGYKIALASEGFAVVAEEIFAHHEKWDGSGYPRNLTTEDIPYLARIISIIDAYDVMIHEQPYSIRLCKKDALEEINNCVGSQFDPELAEAFIEMIGKTV